MSNDNYPAGVSDAHPYFNPPRESATAVECGADAALVVPSFKIKGDLLALQERITRMNGPKESEHTKGLLNLIAAELNSIYSQIAPLEQEREYECPFNDEIDLEESECARWDCPVCGNERETDNLPEDRDPDYEYDRRGDDD